MDNEKAQILQALEPVLAKHGVITDEVAKSIRKALRKNDAERINELYETVGNLDLTQTSKIKVLFGVDESKLIRYVEKYIKGNSQNEVKVDLKGLGKPVLIAYIVDILRGATACDKNNPCDEDQTCNLNTGKCMVNNVSSPNVMEVNGRRFFGSPEALQALQREMNQKCNADNKFMCPDNTYCHIDKEVCLPKSEAEGMVKSGSVEVFDYLGKKVIGSKAAIERIKENIRCLKEKNFACPDNTICRLDDENKGTCYTEERIQKQQGKSSEPIIVDKEKRIAAPKSLLDKVLSSVFGIKEKVEAEIGDRERVDQLRIQIATLFGNENVRNALLRNGSEVFKKNIADVINASHDLSKELTRYIDNYVKIFGSPETFQKKIGGVAAANNPANLEKVRDYLSSLLAAPAPVAVAPAGDDNLDRFIDETLLDFQEANLVEIINKLNDAVLLDILVRVEALNEDQKGAVKDVKKHVTRIVTKKSTLEKLKEHWDLRRGLRRLKEELLRAAAEAKEEAKGVVQRGGAAAAAAAAAGVAPPARAVVAPAPAARVVAPAPAAAAENAVRLHRNLSDQEQAELKRVTDSLRKCLGTV